MVKRQTRKKLIERLMDLIWLSSGKPVLTFIVEEVDSEGYYELGSEDRTYYDLDGIVSKLMDLSLTNRIVKIRYQEYVIAFGLCVFFDVVESKDITTNIDADMLDLILRLNCKKVHSHNYGVMSQSVMKLGA